MRNRREFLADSARVSIGGLAALASYGCEERREETSRVRIIKQLQQSASGVVEYTGGQGYVYDVNVAGERVHVNLSAVYFENHSNLLKYTIRDTSVRVYRDGKMGVWSKNIRVSRPEAITLAQKKTDEVLEAVTQENNRLSKINKSDLLKDLK